MKIPINLASQPFRRDRPMIVASSAVCLLLAGTLGVLVYLAIQDDQQMADIRHQVAVLKQQVQTTAAEQGKLDTISRKPENATVLERSVFINALLQRKGISWNQIFTDLENTLPYNVKLTRIHPTIDSEGHILLDMILASEAPGPANEALKAFRANPIFGPVRMTGFSQPTQTEPLFRVTMSVPYAQKL